MGLKIETIDISRLQPFEGNPKTHPKSQIDLLKKSLQEFGWTVPVLIDDENVVIAGHGRLEAAVQLGLADIPVIRLSDMTPAQARAYRIADNKLTELGGWDQHLLAAEIEALLAVDYDAELTGFDNAEIERLMKDLGEAQSEDIPKLPETPVAQTGDVWQIGDHRIVVGDSTDKAAWDALGFSGHLMVTDPPYGVDYEAEWRIGVFSTNTLENTAQGNAINDHRADWKECWGHFRGDVIYQWCANVHVAQCIESLRRAGFDHRYLIIWAKQKIVPGRGHYHHQYEPCLYAVRSGGKSHWHGGRKESTLWQIDRNLKSESGHSNQKPIECMARPIRNHTLRGDAVVDPFLGSGTTLVAAHGIGRIGYGIEINPAYADISIERIAEATGEKPQKI